ncbi:MAG TPA: phytanoyl-CoA dioxygenase family protein [bacterium]|nr:phytanoyl-CoA dioxygenase family protein [bacterium]
MLTFRKSESAVDFHKERLEILGYTILRDVVGADQVAKIRSGMDAAYARHEATMGREQLAEIKELDVLRGPLVSDDQFLALAATPAVLNLVREVVGDYIVLNQQNCVINRPQTGHHQTSWHRDLPYQNFVISRPLAISALFCIDDFTLETGGTVLVPYTHRMEILPSPQFLEEHHVIAEAKAGSVLVFDSMLLHRAGENRSRQVRRAVNHVYTVPILRQQIDLPRALNGRHADDPALRRLLGYDAETPASVGDWLSRRHK